MEGDPSVFRNDNDFSLPSVSQPSMFKGYTNLGSLCLLPSAPRGPGELLPLLDWETQPLSQCRAGEGGSGGNDVSALPQRERPGGPLQHSHGAAFPGNEGIM